MNPAFVKELNELVGIWGIYATIEHLARVAQNRAQQDEANEEFDASKEMYNIARQLRQIAR